MMVKRWWAVLLVVLAACSARDSRPAEEPPWDRAFTAGRFDEAIHLLRQAAEDSPGNPQVALRLYQAYLALGLHAEALVTLAGGPSLGGGHGERLCQAALVDIFGGEQASLAARTDSLVALGLADNDDLECAAFNEVFLLRYQDALGHLEELARRTGTPEWNLGFLYHVTGRTAEAAAILDAAEAEVTRRVEVSDTDWEARFELAELASMRGRVGEAIRRLEEASRLGLLDRWWAWQVLSPEAIPDPVFAAIAGEPGFLALRGTFLERRTAQRVRLLAPR